MILYVLRHAEAVVAAENLPEEWRYLTEKGSKAVAKISRDLPTYGRKPRLIVTSPLVRAVQTAQIAAGHACRKNELIVSGMLLGDVDNDELYAFLRSHAKAKRLMLVGHEPYLGALVANLLQKENPIQLMKSGCVALKLDLDAIDKPAKFIWYMEPGRKPVTSLKGLRPPKNCQQASADKA